MNEIAKCELCGEPMPQGEEMFKFHGYSGPCPKPPMVKQNWMTKLEIQQEEIETLRQKLADSQKQVILLRDALRHLWNERTPDSLDAAGEALVATDDMSQYILCEKDPVAWENSELYPEIVDHQRRTTDEPLYRAATAPKEKL